MQECHPEPIRSAQGKLREGSLSGERSFAALRMTKRDGLVFEMYWGQGHRTRTGPPNEDGGTERGWGQGHRTRTGQAPSLLYTFRWLLRLILDMGNLPRIYLMGRF